MVKLLPTPGAVVNLTEWVSTLFHVRPGVPWDAIQIHGEAPPYTRSRGEPHRVGEYTVPFETWVWRV